MPGPVAARKRSFAGHGHGAVKTAPYKAPVNTGLPYTRGASGTPPPTKHPWTLVRREGS